MPPGLALAGRAQRHVPHPAPSAQTPLLIHPHPHPTPTPSPPHPHPRGRSVHPCDWILFPACGALSAQLAPDV